MSGLGDDYAMDADDQLEEDQICKPLEGQLVEIFGMQGILVKSVAVQDEDAEPREVDVDGQTGRCAGWFESEGKYIVETFDGILASIPEDNVRAYFPPPPSEGGFDLPWPSDVEDSALFGELVCQEIVSKGYCLIQTYMSDKEREEAITAAETANFYRMKQEIEGGYMGIDSCDKVARLEHDDTGEEDDFTNPLESCNSQMTTLGILLAPLTFNSFGFSCHGRLSGMIRMSIGKNEEDELPSESITDDEDSTEWSGKIESWIRFQQRRRLAIICFLKNEGGDFWLYPKKGLGSKSMYIPMVQNRILIFRHDLMEYSYQAQGPSLALQTWILNDPPKSQDISEMQLNLGVSGVRGEVVVNPGPSEPDGPQASIMALTTRLPGASSSPSDYWLMYCAGSDCCQTWPKNRWDIHVYYQEGTDTSVTGKAYTRHGGFIAEEMMMRFDNEFFGITREEAKSMVPGQRISLEVGYQCLAFAGFKRQSLAGRRIGTWYGDVGPDWHSFHSEWGREWASNCPEVNPSVMGFGLSNSVTAGRIAYTFDLRGPVSSYDTACSASLVAMNAAHLTMFDSCTPKNNAEALVSGVNTMLGPSSFIGNCMTNALSHQGRSFTFNSSADGYQRGEGTGSVFIKLIDGNKKDAEARVCALIGSATNQDGMSASLTAPNGPSQQAVIRKSMAFASINPNTISITECHGTGTALGDPIEVGALMEVMHWREFPLLKSSAKSHIAHAEAAAGIAGLAKCIVMIQMATAPPNCHLSIMNPHLTTTGYPVHFNDAHVDTGFSTQCCGVSSFGFGGTNARADVYGCASKGHKAMIRFELPKPNGPRVQPFGQTVYICGTWTGWSDYEELDGGWDGTYRCAVTLGDTRQEKFYLSCTQDTYEAIHPLVDDADASAQVVGPDWDGKGLYWMIDGDEDDAPVGTIYEITFKWMSEKKSISWRRAGEMTNLNVLGDKYEHKFYLTGSWRLWEGYDEMTRVAGEDCYECRFKIGFRCEEEFQIVRDADPNQTFHPSCARCLREGVPVLGPDGLGKGKHWLVRGPQHDAVTVRISFDSGKAAVRVTTLGFASGLRPRTWLSWESWARARSRKFHLLDSSTGEELTPMVQDSMAPGLHTCQIALMDEASASFQIVVNEDRGLLLYPNEQLALSGPDADAATAWYIEGMRGSIYLIKLNLSERDRTKMLTWEPVSLEALI